MRLLAFFIAVPFLQLAQAVPAAAHEPFVEEVRVFTTPEGLRAVLARRPAAPGARPRVFTGLYTRMSTTTEPIPGAAHMIEHLIANAPPAETDFSFPKDGRRLDSNAQARPDYIAVWRTYAPETALAGAFALSGRLWGIVITDEIIEHQRGRVIAEHERGADRASWDAGRALEHAFYGRRPSMAEEAVITADYDGGEMRVLASAALAPEHAVLVVAGDIDIDAFENALRGKSAERGPIPRPADGERAWRFEPAAFSEPRELTVWEHPAAEGVWILAGYATPEDNGEDLLALLIADQLMLGGRDSFEALWDIERDDGSPLGRRLTQELPSYTGVGDGRGYGAASPPLAESHPSYLNVFFHMPEGTPENAAAGLRRALRRVRDEAMDDASIEQARAELIDFYRRWLNDDTLRPLGDHLAGLTIQGDGSAARMATLHEEIAAVTPDAVRRAFDDYVLDGDLRAAAIVRGPHEGE